MKKTLHHLLVLAVCSTGSLGLARGAEPGVKLSSTALNFPSQSAGTVSALERVVLTDDGAASLTIVEIAISGENLDAFSQTNNCPLSPATLAAGASCTIEVTFRPSIVGQMVAVLTITDNASGSPHGVQLRGDAAARVSAAKLSPPNLTFGNQVIGSTSLPQTITIANVGSEVLNITSPIGITERTRVNSRSFHRKRVAPWVLASFLRKQVARSVSLSCPSLSAPKVRRSLLSMTVPVALTLSPYWVLAWLPLRNPSELVPTRISRPPCS